MFELLHAHFCDTFFFSLSKHLKTISTVLILLCLTFFAKRVQIYLGQNEKWEREKNTKKNKGWKKDFQNAKKKSQTCALMQKKESDADDAPSQTASPITSVSTAVHINCLVCQEKKKEKKKKKKS